jgi:hypothetical protein
VAVAAVLAVFAALAGVWAVFLQGGDGGPSGPPRAAIVDQLSLTAPNAEFADDARALLEGAGYTVDYFPGEDIDVDFYRKLPAYGYKFIVFRVHADRLQAVWRGEQIDDVVLFSSEKYDRNRYVPDQAANRLVIANYINDPQDYFGVTPDFFDELGDFDDTTIIMMGCEGLVSERAAQAFVDKGASTYISWDETVSATHTDAATKRLLELMLVDQRDPAAAVAETMSELGPDPTFGSKLVAFPQGS